MRVRTRWTARAGLLWAIALVIAAALACWDYTDQRSADSARPKGDANSAIEPAGYTVDVTVER